MYMYAIAMRKEAGNLKEGGPIHRGVWREGREGRNVIKLATTEKELISVNMATQVCGQK